MNHGVIATIVFAELMDLGVTIVTGRDTIVGTGGFDLLIFYFPELQTFILETGLEKTTAAPAAIVVRPIGLHIDKILFTHHGLDDKAQIIGDGIPV